MPAAFASAAPHKELAWLFLLALLWGSSYLLIRVAVVEIPPLTLIAARVSVAAALLLIVVRGQGYALPPVSRLWWRIMLQSILNSVGAWTLLAWGQQYVDSALAGVLNSTAPIFVFFITAFVTHHEPVNIRRLIGAMLGLSGVVLIMGTDALQGLGQQVLAQAAVLAGALLYAGAAIHGKRFHILPPTVTAAATMLCASLVLVPVSLITDRPWTLAPSAMAVAATLALGVLCTALALLIYFRLLKTLGSMGTASQAYLRAGVSVLLGVVVLDERLHVAVAAGLALAIAGVAAINIPARKPAQ